MGDTVAMRSRLTRAAAALVVVVAGLVIGTANASAHSVLLETAPSSGGTVAKPPKEIRLTFNEGVEAAPDAIRLFDSRGRQVAIGDTRHADGKAEVIAAPVTRIRDGSYVVAWRAVSADSHPVSGAFTFAVGTASAGEDTRGLVSRLVDDTGSTTVAVVLAVTRWVIYLAASIAIGGLVLLWMCWPRGWDSRRARRWLTWSTVAVAAGSLVSIGAQGAYGAAQGVGSIFDPSLWGDVAATRFGEVALLRAVAAIVMLLGIRGLTRARTRALVAVTAVASGAVIVSLAAANHGLTGRWVAAAFVVDIVHISAMVVWLGGLVGLVAWVLRPDVEADVDAGVAAVRRFSTVALVAVGAIVVTGIIQSARQVGGFPALTSTRYGAVLLVKVALVAVVVSVAWVSRRLTHAWADRGSIDGASDPDLVERETRRYLRRSVGVEVGMMMAVLAASTILSSTIPAIEAVALPFKQTVITDQGFAEVSVDPARVGTTQLHVTVTNPDGSATQVDDLSVAISLGDPKVGPLDIPMDRYGSVPNHFVAPTAGFPFPGVWDLEVRARVGQFEERVFTVQVPVR